ncbi:hypothetical protein ABGB12_15315 [Actinocorallia sp. B10E7]|uniref:hypothetical protein n=1 Tax=Actinocorallia sp. B10E7 TaxID=3153558 RepID=UPI00325D80C2
MGLFNRIGKALNEIVGGVDSEVVRIGRPARAELLRITPQTTAVRVAPGVVERVCELLVEITLEDGASYRTLVRQRIPELYLEHPDGLALLSAKVHPHDPRRVVLDLDTPLPLSAPLLPRHGRSGLAPAA